MKRACLALLLAFAVPGISAADFPPITEKDRTLTAVPWAGHVLLGTHQSSQPVDPRETGPPADAVQELLSDASSAFPALAAGAGDVRLVHDGLTPAVVRGGRADLLPDHRVLKREHGHRPSFVRRRKRLREPLGDFAELQ